MDAWTSCENINLIFHKIVQLESILAVHSLPVLSDFFNVTI